LFLGELLYGSRASARHTENLKILREFVNLVYVADFSYKSADLYSKIRLSLRMKGRPAGEADMMIAAVAMENNSILVTDNTKHFQNIDGLEIENWLRS